MNRTVRLLILIALAPLAPAPGWANDCSHEIAGYYPSWARYRPFLPAEIDWTSVASVHHAFLDVLADATLHENADYAFTRPLLVAAAEVEGVRVLAAVGGAFGCTGKHLQAIAADPVLRGTLAQNLATYCVSNGYDGIVIDWEFPGVIIGEEPTCSFLGKDPEQCAVDRQNFVSLSTEIRARFDAEDPPLLLRVALPMTAWFGECYDGAAIADLYDSLEIMAYEMHGGWAGHAGHNAQLFEPSYDPHGGVLSVDTAIDYWNLTQGVAAERLLLGVPFYGYGYPSACGLGHADVNGFAVLDYEEVARDFLDQGWTRFFDPTAQVPYLLRDDGCGVVSYDDPLSIAVKVDLGVARGLGGFMIWELTHGYVADGAGQPLLDAIAKPLCHSPEACDNGIDDDADTRVDCEDPDCATAPNCCLLQLDADCDGDGVPNADDCAPLEADAFAIPGEVPNVWATKIASVPWMSWTDLAAVSGDATVYDVVVAALPGLHGGDPRIECLVDNVADPTLEASAWPGPGGTYYLVRARNACGTGTYGRPEIDAQSPCD